MTPRAGMLTFCLLPQRRLLPRPCSCCWSLQIVCFSLGGAGGRDVRVVRADKLQLHLLTQKLSLPSSRLCGVDDRNPRKMRVGAAGPGLRPLLLGALVLALVPSSAFRPSLPLTSARLSGA